MEKELIFKSEFTSIYILPENSVIEQIWENNDDLMTGDCFKREMQVFFNLFRLYKYEKICFNAGKLNYLIDTNLREWIHKKIAPIFITFTEKAAFVLPKDIFEEISVVQTVEEATDNFDKTEYFKNDNEAYKWLLN